MSYSFCFCCILFAQSDLLLVSNRKTEIVITASESYKKSMLINCPVIFSNTFAAFTCRLIIFFVNVSSIDFRNEDKVLREIRFNQTEGFSSISFFLNTLFVRRYINTDLVENSNPLKVFILWSKIRYFLVFHYIFSEAKPFSLFKC